jgi:precorrin-6B methylase 2
MCPGKNITETAELTDKFSAWFFNVMFGLAAAMYNGIPSSFNTMQIIMMSKGLTKDDITNIAGNITKNGESLVVTKAKPKSKPKAVTAAATPQPADKTEVAAAFATTLQG